MSFRSFIQPKQNAYKTINWFPLFTEGHQKAFSHYFELLYPPLFILTRRTIMDPEAAKKIVLAAFIIAWKSREDFARQDQLKSFLYEEVKSNCTTYHLSLAKPQPFIDWDSKGPHIERIHAEILAEMFQKLDHLPEDSRWVLHHAITERQTRAQLAKKWDISENAAAIRKSRAFKKLLSLLSESGPDWFLLLLLLIRF